MILGQEDHDHDDQEGIEDNISQHESSVRWVYTPTPTRQQHSWDSDRSGDYLVTSIRSKNKTELRVAGAKLLVAISGKKTSVLIDNGSPISIFTIGELNRTLGAAGVNLCNFATEDPDFRDYRNNPLSLMVTSKVQLASNGWKMTAVIKVIGENRPSKIGRDLMAELGLLLVQKAPGQ